MSNPDEDFATMFEVSQRARRVTKGEIIDGTIVAIGEESALVDVGSKSEAEIDIDELTDDNGALEIKVGDRIQAMVVSTAGGLRLSRAKSRPATGCCRTSRVRTAAGSCSRRSTPRTPR